MSLYEIVNPSDPYTIECPFLDVAAMVSVLLGQGKYSFRSLDSCEDVPMFAFGGADEWCQKKFGENLMEMSNRVMDTKLVEVADSLDSVLYGDREDRAEFLEATKDMDSMTREAHRMIEQNRKRSSLNAIGERAYRMAAKLRKSIAEGLSTVQ